MEHYPFPFKPLPYLYDALEPSIDMETLYFHHTKHLRTYIDNLNHALAPYKEFHDWTLERLLYSSGQLPETIRETVRRNAGGVYSHELYFESVTPRPSTPAGKLLEALLLDFRSVSVFRDIFEEMALELFGSGYLWLVADGRGKLAILPLPNQEVPISPDLYPLLNLDLWEHAYYLKHQNRRMDYIQNWFSVVNWNEVERKYRHALLSIALKHGG